jgi:hypothetical protein
VVVERQPDADVAREIDVDVHALAHAGFRPSMSALRRSNDASFRRSTATPSSPARS